MKTTERQNNFNLVRLVLALLVLLSHSPELVDGNRSREIMTQFFGTMSFGELAVDGFFLLSGYLIMQSWTSQPQAWPFLKKRLLRIYPGFVIASILSALVVGPLASDPDTYFVSFHVPSFLSSVSFLQLPAVPEVFDGTHYAILNGSMWTISKEFACYLFVLFAGVTGALRFRAPILIIAIAVFAAFIDQKIGNNPAPDLRLAACFLSGACFYSFRAHIRYSGVAAALATGMVFVAMYSWRGAELAFISIGGYALLYAAKKRSALLSRFNRLPDVSYGVYLYGWPIQKMLLWYVPSMSPWILFALSVPLALLAGALSWYLIEKPALRFKGPTIRIQEDTELTIAR